jgi:hypothetical protein
MRLPCTPRVTLPNKAAPAYTKQAGTDLRVLYPVSIDLDRSNLPIAIVINTKAIVD